MWRRLSALIPAGLTHKSVSKSEICRIEDTRQLCCKRQLASGLLAKAFRLLEARCADPGRGRRNRAQREPESATQRSRDSPQEKQSTIRPKLALPLGYGR
jgi:hypothetical protein